MQGDQILPQVSVFWGLCRSRSLACTEVRGLSREKGLYNLTSHETNSQLPQSLPLNSFRAARNLQSVRRNNPGPVSNTSALVSRLFDTVMSVSMTPKETK